jgi:hypothetical protein
MIHTRKEIYSMIVVIQPIEYSLHLLHPGGWGESVILQEDKILYRIIKKLIVLDWRKCCKIWKLYHHLLRILLKINNNI